MLKGSLRCTVIKMNSISKITLRGSNFSRFRCASYVAESCILKGLRYDGFGPRDIVLISSQTLPFTLPTSVTRPYIAHLKPSTYKEDHRPNPVPTSIPSFIPRVQLHSTRCRASFLPQTSSAPLFPFVSGTHQAMKAPSTSASPANT